MKTDNIFKYYDQSVMNEPQYFFIAEVLDNGYLLCRTDFMLRGEQPNFTDFWEVSNHYLYKLMGEGKITIEQ